MQLYYVKVRYYILYYMYYMRWLTCGGWTRGQWELVWWVRLDGSAYIARIVYANVLFVASAKTTVAGASICENFWFACVYIKKSFVEYLLTIICVKWVVIVVQFIVNWNVNTHFSWEIWNFVKHVGLVEKTGRRTYSVM